MAGELKLLAVLAPQRLGGAFRAVPTAREQGVDVVWQTVRGLYMGPGVAEKDAAEWARTLRRAMATREYARLLNMYALQPFAVSGAEIDAYVRQKVQEMRALAGSLHLRVR